jgi:hypothetical protein
MSDSLFSSARGPEASAHQAKAAWRGLASEPYPPRLRSKANLSIDSALEIAPPGRRRVLGKGMQYTRVQRCGMLVVGSVSRTGLSCDMLPLTYAADVPETHLFLRKEKLAWVRAVQFGSEIPLRAFVHHTYAQYSDWERGTATCCC